MNRRVWEEEARKEAAQSRRIRRQEKLFDDAMTVAEKLLEQVEQMLAWPLAEQVLIRPAENGEMAKYIIKPVGWNKNTVKYIFDIVSS